MALSRIASMPTELKLLTYAELHPHDLLSISHVSKFWGSIVLEDKRWNEWFALLSTDTETAAAFLSRHKILDLIPRRAIVTLCFYTKCSGCASHTTDISLPLLQRVCLNCRRDEKWATISLSSALTTYDLNEKELGDLLILHWEEVDPAVKKKLGMFYKAKLMSELAVTESAIQKHGGEANLATHLEGKKATIRAAYEERIAD
ncbi:hypothetical protein DFH09DRAFT_131479 [Mycena vulgaris]|nr:hypothetical protein DFH09DRAFT_131479 [Mycena vulgaris]